MIIKLKDILFISLVVLSAISASSCGSGDFVSSGGWGEDRTYTRVDLDLSPEATSVDACDPSSVAVMVNASTAQVNPELPENILQLEGYGLSFAPVDASSPPLAGGRFGQSKALPFEGLSLLFVDEGMKAAFIDDINSGLYNSAPDFPAYTASYTLYGTDAFTGESMSWGEVASFSFRMGKYTDCDSYTPSAPVMMPEYLSLTACLNPDVCTSDDLTFYVSGGIAPYKVYSDSALIVVPSDIPLGQTSFAVDPNRPAAITEVAITLVDSIGQTVISTVQLIP